MTKDGAVFAKGKVKGEVNFPPFEDLDEETMREVQRFQVYPLGKIQEYCRHIPYNSEKKSFLEKTGRESFEVFQYIFKVPGNEKDFTVMWDYNIGLVRITPFFKCCNYSKTTPAKMLNMNPGLKEITHSITGGALAAQGYWMPYSCALAVCTTFCAHIAPALIPIFGPSFPSQCVPQPEHGRWTIDPAIITKATREAEAFRLLYSNSHSSSTTAYSPKSVTSHRSGSMRSSYSPKYRERPHVRTSPLSTQTQGGQQDIGLDRRLRLKRAFGSESHFGVGTPSDTDFEINGSEASSTEGGYFCSPATPVSGSSSAPNPRLNDWRAANMLAHGANSGISLHIPMHKQHTLPGPNPMLSAIPRSSGFLDEAIITRNWPGKRRVEEVDADDEYDGGESSASPTDEKGSEHSDRGVEDTAGNGSAVGGSEKKAAWLLMKLSVKDGECGVLAAGVGAGLSGNGDSDREVFDVEEPRIKRRKAMSM
ncbi:hypothetical protein B0J14DRAFT_200750 [Halenospora varia]|nr:hypothetical protein B0J14DRAFT_200750 [Halenospora varia]